MIAPRTAMIGPRRTGGGGWTAPHAALLSIAATCGLGCLGEGRISGILETHPRDAQESPARDADPGSFPDVPGRDARVADALVEGRPRSDAGPEDVQSSDEGVGGADRVDPDLRDADATDAGAADGDLADLGVGGDGFTDTGDATTTDSGVLPPAADGGLVAGTVLKISPDTESLDQATTNPDFIKPLWDGTRWVVFWERKAQSCVNPPGPSNLTCTITSRALMATVLRTDGTAQSVNLVYPLDTYQNPYRDLDVIAAETGFLATWVEPSGPELTAVTTIHVLALDSTFAPVHHESFSSGGGWWPKLAGRAGTYALFWQEHTPHQQDWFAPLGADGRPGAPVAVSMFVPRLGHHLTTEIAFDGTSFGLVYESDAERLVRCGCDWSTNGHPVEVFLMLLSPSGARLATTRLSEGIEEGMEMMTGNHITAVPGGGFSAVWISSVSGARDIVLARVDGAGQKIGSNVRLTQDGQRTIEINPRISAITDGYIISYALNDGSIDWAYGVAALRLDRTGALLASSELVTPPPACSAFERIPGFAGVRCSVPSRGLSQAARDQAAVTAWSSVAWTTLPGDGSGEQVVGHLGSIVMTHW